MNENKNLDKIINEIGINAKTASFETAQLNLEQRNSIIKNFAKNIENSLEKIIKVNSQEVSSHSNLNPVMKKRLALDEPKIRSLIDSLYSLIKLSDPLSGPFEQWQAPAGFKIIKKIVPLGVIAMIYEARPNVTVDAASLAIKSGNAIILRGGKEAINTNKFLVSLLRESLKHQKLNPNFVQLIEDTSRDSADRLLHLRDYLDLLIPRGSQSFIDHVVRTADVPVIETGAGNDHIFVDESADQRQAVKIIVNAKTQNPAVCNAAEKLLVHKNIAKEFIPKISEALIKKGVELRGDNQSLQIFPGIKKAEDSDWGSEYNDLIMSIKVVDDLDSAIDWISKYTTHHTEVILTKSPENTIKFMNSIDAAVVMENMSSRFTDGHEFGFGSEIGISTQKLHARGPMGIKALTSYKYQLYGHGETRS